MVLEDGLPYFGTLSFISDERNERREWWEVEIIRLHSGVY